MPMIHVTAQPKTTIYNPSSKEILSVRPTKINGKNPKIVHINALNNRAVVEVSFKKTDIKNEMNRNMAFSNSIYPKCFIIISLFMDPILLYLKI